MMTAPPAAPDPPGPGSPSAASSASGASPVGASPVGAPSVALPEAGPSVPGVPAGEAAAGADGPALAAGSDSPETVSVANAVLVPDAPVADHGIGPAPRPPAVDAAPPGARAADPAGGAAAASRPAAGAPVATRGAVVGPVLIVLGFLILAGGLFWVWRQQSVRHGSVRQGAPTNWQAELGALRTRLAQQNRAQVGAIAAFAARVTALEHRSTPPTTTGTAAGAAAIAALGARTQALAHELGVMSARLDALAAQQGTTGHALTSLGQQQVAAAQHLAALDQRIAALAAQRDMRATDSKAGLAGLRQALAVQLAAETALARRLNALAHTEAQTARLVALQGAAAALAAGRPLGSLPGAPPALARFATTTPPTEAALRLAFPAAARAALVASRPQTKGKPLLERLWARAQLLVMVRQGSRVILGDPASGQLAAAEARLDAGDLAGAVAELAALDAPARAAIAAWRHQAQALLAARAALARLETGR